MHVRFAIAAVAIATLLLAPFAALAGYDVGPEDVLEIRVADEPGLSGEYPVSEEGTIVYPLLGALPVKGKEITEITSVIRERLGADYLVSPQVAIYIKSYGSKKVAVLGDVPSPGFYTLQKDRSILSVLADAGLPLSGGDRQIIITRAHSAEADAELRVPIVLSLEKLQSPWHTAEPVVLGAGDRVYVKSDTEGKVFVQGKVKRPGTLTLRAGMTLMEAINSAGGLAEFGSLKGVRVVRESKEGADVISVDLNAVLEGDRSNDVPLEDGDIIIVPRRWF
ncbi:MAG: polysaccharide biosynthesis/export family protein [Verrucomicrobia bacterium]|nr:polysaccharide biosynthesis/export family protein [Verrucomicrobiota bacterium]MDA1087297.1 polysaccharide biosynthesis/export family protein [Verrucomicrobiota bacterium]